MEKQQKILALIMFIFAAAALTLVISNYFLVKPADNGNGNANNKADTKGWQTYRNDDYGFSIQYPGYLSATDYIPENKDILPSCGEPLGQTFRAHDPKNPESVFYEISVYSNPQNIKPEEFFDCAAKTGAKNNAQKPKDVKVFLAGDQEYDAARIALGDNQETVIIVSSKYIYEINRQNTAGGLAIESDFTKAIATLEFTDTDNSSAQTQPEEFCASSAKNSFGDGLLAFSQPLKKGSDSDFFIGCVEKLETNQVKWQLSEKVFIYHISNGEPVWSGVVGKNANPALSSVRNFDWPQINQVASAGDVNNDGFDEAIFVGGGNTGDCGQDYSYWCLYSPTQKDTFCVASRTGWGAIADVTAQFAQKDCPVFETTPHQTGDRCDTDKYHALCFDDEKMKKPEYKDYRDYLQKIVVPDI